MSEWPPTNESPYSNPKMAELKPGNFFTLREEDHPAYDLYRALAKQGWSRKDHKSRHWVTLTKDDRYITFSLFGQGGFGCRNEHGEYGIGLEDFDNVWTGALPHITTFMRIMADQWNRVGER